MANKNVRTTNKMTFFSTPDWLVSLPVSNDKGKYIYCSLIWNSIEIINLIKKKQKMKNKDEFFQFFVHCLMLWILNNPRCNVHSTWILELKWSFVFFHAFWARQSVFLVVTHLSDSQMKYFGDQLRIFSLIFVRSLLQILWITIFCISTCRRNSCCSGSRFTTTTKFNEHKWCCIR